MAERSQLHVQTYRNQPVQSYSRIFEEFLWLSCAFSGKSLRDSVYNYIFWNVTHCLLATQRLPWWQRRLEPVLSVRYELRLE